MRSSILFREIMMHLNMVAIHVSKCFQIPYINFNQHFDLAIINDCRLVGTFLEFQIRIFNSEPIKRTVRSATAPSP